MVFEKIDRSSWKRNEYFEHYFTNIPCTYSMTVKLDITQIKKKRMKLYPAMLYYLATIVNRHSEFRTAINQEGDRKSTRLNSSHRSLSRMPSSA